MAERRMIWKLISISRKVNRLSLKAALLYSWAIPWLDRDGYLEVEDDYIKYNVLPRRDDIPLQEIEPLVNEIIDEKLWEGFILPDGRRAIFEPKFKEMQKGSVYEREAESKILKQLNDNSKSDHKQLSMKGKEIKLKESKGKEIKKKETQDPLVLPTFEEIEEASKTKLEDHIKEITEKLYEGKIFPKVHSFINKMKKQKKNSRAILHVLSRCYIGRPKEPWSYCQKIIEQEDGNYNAKDHQKTYR